jgi:crotonobetainyl-CoA:carnitine CoA-transferase CaiB-like acyl-CoA transferase
MSARTNAPPLAGLRVLEISRSPSAGFCGRQFHLWGAQVTMAEPGDAEGLRSFELRPGPNGEPFSASFAYLAAGKVSVPINGSAAIAALIQQADVVVSDIHPQDEVLVFGQSLEQIHRGLPGLVIASISPFGRTGSHAARDATALQLQALSGYLSLNGRPDEPPLPAPGHLIDHVIGANAFLGAMAALVRSRRTGRGDLVEVSGLETVAGLMPYLREQFAESPTLREGGTPEGVRLLPCSDGWIAMLLTVPAYAEIYGEVLGVDVENLPSDLFDGERREIIARGEAYFGGLTIGRSRHELFGALQSRGIVCGPVLELNEVLASPQLAASGFFERHPDVNGGEPSLAGRPARMNRGPAGPRRKRSSPDDDAPLSGFTVLELSQAWMGPLAGQILADLGAEVIKIENPDRPDIWRLMGQQPQRSDGPPVAAHDRSVYFQSVNRNKQSLGLDLNRPDDLATLRALVVKADVVLENFTPQVMSRLGLGFDDLRQLRPDLVMTSFSGFGANGPLSHHKANGASIEAMAGWDSLHCDASGDPVLMGGYPADPVCALQMAACTLVALFAREGDSAGAHVEGSMLAAAAAYIGDDLLAASLGLCPVEASHEVVRSLGQDCWDAVSKTAGKTLVAPMNSLAQALAADSLVLSAWFLTLKDPGLGLRIFNGRFWRFHSARLPEPMHAPALAV